MSLWIESPELIDTRLGQGLFRFKDVHWPPAHAQWLDDAAVQIALRKYPGDHHRSSFHINVN